MIAASHRAVRLATASAPGPDAVEARVQYVIPAVIKPFSYEYEPPRGVPLRTVQFVASRVLIHDARQLAVPASLDVEGFALHRQATRVRDFYDDTEVHEVYYPEVERLLKATTGARSILIFDHTVRGSAAPGDGRAAVKEPVNRVHNDYTPRSGVRRVKDLLPARIARRLLQHRVLEINAWRPIRGPVRTMPLAVCDAASMRPEDFVACDLIYRDRVGEIHYVAYSKRHRWYYYPDMQRDETLLLKCFDSDPARDHTGAHAAFEHPGTPPDAPPRESIEVRAFAFFAPE
jgi:hypothetical protein